MLRRKIFKTDIFQDIVNVCIELFKENYNNNPVRKITIGLSQLESQDDEVQLDLFTLQTENEIKSKNGKLENINRLVDDMQEKFGVDKVSFGNVIDKNIN